MKKKKLTLGDLIGLAVVFCVFVIPFLFMFVNSLKERREANLLRITWRDNIRMDNYVEVLKTSNGIVLTAFKNSVILTFFSVVLLVILCSMAGYVLQRRKDRAVGVINVLIMTGLMVPPAIMPTIWVLQGLHIYKTLLGMILVETALLTPFTITLYRSYMSAIPKELEEVGYIDGCNRIQMFFRIIFPLLKPVNATVIILNAVSVFNDFTNPLYFLPGNANATIQLTLYNFMGKYSSSYNLLFADVIIITIPMVILFIIFNRQIVDGMVAGAIKG